MENNKPTLDLVPLKLNPGQDLLGQIRQECHARGIRAGFVISGIGSLKKLKIRLANSKDSLEKIESFEILSLQGSISTDGLHLHISAADSRGITLGGHVLTGCEIYTTAEILLIHCSDFNFQRLHDPKTGYLELSIQKKS